MNSAVRASLSALAALLAAGAAVPSQAMSSSHLVRIASLARACPSTVAPRVVGAVMEHESGGDPLAIGDNDGHRGYHPASTSDAAALAHQLADVEGHSIDVGVMQLNSANVRAYGLSWTAAFDLCTNVQYCSRILANAYAAAPGDGDYRLLHALSAYNTGHYFSSQGANYAELVRGVALAMPREAFTGGRHPSAAARSASRYRQVAIAPRSSLTYRVYAEPVPRKRTAAKPVPKLAPIVVEAAPTAAAVQAQDKQ